MGNMTVGARKTKTSCKKGGELRFDQGMEKKTIGPNDVPLGTGRLRGGGERNSFGGSNRTNQSGIIRFSDLQKKGKVVQPRGGKKKMILQQKQWAGKKKRGHDAHYKIP